MNANRTRSVLATLLTVSVITAGLSVSFGAKIAHAQANGGAQAAGAIGGTLAGCALGLIGIGGTAGTGVAALGAKTVVTDAAGIATPGVLVTADVGQRMISAAGNDLAIANLAANTTVAAHATNQSTVTCSLNGIAWALAKVAIQSITKSTVNWINSGYQGSPAFVTDLSKSLRQTGDAFANSFVNQLVTQESLQSPFINQVAQAVGAAYYLDTNKNAIAWQLKYTLNNVTANDRAFINGENFHQGGFNAWMAMTQNPANNPFGANFIAGEKMSQQVAAAANNKLKELDFGKGFLSWKGDCQASNQDVAGEFYSGPSANLSDADKCATYSIQTPGSVVESQLEQQLGSPIRQLELADSINEILSAAITQLLSSTLSSSGLLGASRPASGGGSSALNIATNPNLTLNGSVAGSANGFSQTIANHISQIQTYTRNWQKVLSAANAARDHLNTLGCTDLINSKVQSAIDTANLHLGYGSTDLGQFTKLQAQLDAAQSSSDSVNQVVSVTNQYQKLLSSPDTLTADDFSYAVQESSDTGTSNVPSLYTEMTNYVKQTSCTISTTGT